MYSDTAVNILERMIKKDNFYVNKEKHQEQHIKEEEKFMMMK
jgi:hypothetical protein